MIRTAFSLTAAALLASLLPASGVAQVAVSFEQVREVRVDGSLRDWRSARFASVGAGADAAMEIAFRYKNDGIFVGARVTDDRMVRTRRPSTTEDAIIVTFAFPSGSDLDGLELWLFAGVQGQSASMATSSIGGAPRALRGGQIVEAPGRGGYELEAFIPFRALRNSSRWEQGRVSYRLRDVDTESRPTIESEPALTTVDVDHLERLPRIEPTGGTSSMLRNFARSRGLGSAQPRFDLNGNVSGDRRPERVVVLEHYVAVMGAGYRQGAAFDFFELPVSSAAGVRRAELVDVTGDGTRELALVLRQQNDLGARDVYQTFVFDGERILPLFGIEIRKETRAGVIENTVNVRRQGRAEPTITQALGRSRGLTQENFRESAARGVRPILVPWGPHRARVLRWAGEALEVVSEVDNPDHQRVAPSVTVARPAPRVAQPAVPDAPTLDVLTRRYRQRKGIPRGTRPRFALTTNLAEGRPPERLLVFGTTLAVLGTQFRGGAGFFESQLPVEADEDVLDVTTADLTGDGRQEILVRIRRRAEAVTREVLLVHQFTPDSFRRILMVEVARSLESASIQNRVRVQGQGRAATLTVSPGRARGWDASSWPFAAEQEEGVDALLLPWRDAEITYRYRPGRLRRP